MLHIMEAYQDATHREASMLRHFRLDTVEDDQSMPASLQLPHASGETGDLFSQSPWLAASEKLADCKDGGVSAQILHLPSLRGKGRYQSIPAPNHAA